MANICSTCSKKAVNALPIAMNILPTLLADCLVIEPRVFADERGFFMETYHRERYHSAGLTLEFVQDNHSCSKRGTLRGLHYQIDRPQGKLVWAIRGEIFDVAVDLRRSSPTFGRWISVLLSSDNRRQIYVPPGFAHGICALSEEAEIIYKCTDSYSPAGERTILWNDPTLAIAWPTTTPLLSDKDQRGVPLAEAEVFQ
jgi:dTDP-4-dehydrorhamnose 3,5-epimerase